MRRRSARVRSGAAIALYAGIDGGQSSTIAVVGDDRAVLGRGSGPPADLVGEPRDSERRRAALVTALAAALDAAGIPRPVRVRALVAGISGFDGDLSAAPHLTALAERARVVHDTAIAHAGALGGAPGILVIAGTGSAALGNASAAGPYVRCGGWGYFFGDEGSAIWIARTALGAAMRAFDAGTTTAVAERAFVFYGTMSLRAIQHAFAHGDVTRPALAAFAAEVLACAAEGDPHATAARDAAASELGRLTASVDRRLAPAPERIVSRVGGLFRDRAFADAFAAAVTQAVPRARVVAPRSEPADGALALARQLGAGNG